MGFDRKKECEEHERQHHINWKETDNKRIAEALYDLSDGVFDYRVKGTVLGYFVSDFSNLMHEAAKRIEEAEKMSKPAAERQVIVTWYKPEEKLPPEDEYVVITFSGRRNDNLSYEHALGIGVYYQGDGWLIEGMDEIESDFMTIEAWADLDSYGMGEEK